MLAVHAHTRRFVSNHRGAVLTAWMVVAALLQVVAH